MDEHEKKKLKAKLFAIGNQIVLTTAVLAVVVGALLFLRLIRNDDAKQMLQRDLSEPALNEESGLDSGPANLPAE
jgi:hypothetical protein